MKKSIIALSILFATIGYGVHALKSEGLSTRITKHSIQNELQDVYSEYNMLLKNKAHGAPVPQSRLDGLQLKAKQLKTKLAEVK
ncbi:MAG: hypothetical protein ACRCYT_04930 [Cetobacterium sp.]